MISHTQKLFQPQKAELAFLKSFILSPAEHEIIFVPQQLGFYSGRGIWRRDLESKFLCHVSDFYDLMATFSPSCWWWERNIQRNDQTGWIRKIDLETKHPTMSAMRARWAQTGALARRMCTVRFITQSFMLCLLVYTSTYLFHPEDQLMWFFNPAERNWLLLVPQMGGPWSGCIKTRPHLMSLIKIMLLLSSNNQTNSYVFSQAMWNRKTLLKWQT